MKKILLSLTAAMFSMATYAQFFTATTYRGAFGVGAGANWMTGWTNFDPVNTVYPGNGNAAETALGKTRVDIGTSTGSDGYFHITSNTTWTSGNVYYLNNPVAVDAGVTLTIQAGTFVRGLNNPTPTCLVISRGAQLNAVGTSANPIVFTSASVAGSRNSGDWGGLILCGRARVNLNKSPNLGGRNVEGTVTTAPGTASYYGAGNGSAVVNDAESSGNIQYVRCEFAGDAVTANLELNGIMLAGIGSGTTFQYVQVSYSRDDSFEWFGGTVDGKYLVAFGGTDDDFDVDEGYRGRNQFCLAVRDPRFCDYGSSAGSSNFFEMDNNTTSGGNATSDQTQYSPQPTTSCVFSNVTCLGPLRNGEAITSVSDRFGGGWNARTNPATAVFNSIFLNSRNPVVVSSTATITGASTVLNPSNWTKISCDSLILRNSAMIMDPANTNATVSVGGEAGNAADCQNAFATKNATVLEAFFENGTNNNLINKQATDGSSLGISSPWYTGTLTTVPPTTGNFTNGPISWSSFNPTLTSGSPFASGASFTHPRLGISALPSLTVSGAQSVFGDYSSVTVTGTGNATFSGNVSVTGSFTVQSGGTVAFGANNVQGSGSITIQPGANISTTAAGGFANAGNGVTRNSGSKSLSNGANYTFNGTVAQNTGGFWTGGNNVTINNAAGVTLSSAATVGGVLALQSGTFTAGNNLLTINSTASQQGVIDNFSSGFTGTLSATSIRFRRFTPGGTSLRNVAPPVVSSANTINSVFVPAGVACGGTKEFDEFSNTWIPVDVAGGACSDPLVNTPSVLASNSLLVYAVGPRTFEFSGLPQDGNQVRSISRSPGTVPPAPFVARGWNSLGNPYPSLLDWSLFDTPGNLSQSPCIAYVWNSALNNYGTINVSGVTTNGASNLIAPGQGILVRRSSVGTGNVTFSNAMRAAGSTQTFIREAVDVRQEIRLSLRGQTGGDEIMVGSGASVQTIEKCFSPDETSVSLFIPSVEEPLTTLVAELGENYIPVSVVLPSAGAYTLCASSLAGIPAGSLVMLEDKFLGTFTVLNQGETYAFSGKAGSAARFALHVQPASQIQSSPETRSLIYASGNEVVVRLSQTPETASVLTIRDMTGKVAGSYTFRGTGLTEKVNLPTGIYTLSLQSAGTLKTRKVQINN